MARVVWNVRSFAPTRCIPCRSSSSVDRFGLERDGRPGGELGPKSRNEQGSPLPGQRAAARRVAVWWGNRRCCHEQQLRGPSCSQGCSTTRSHRDRLFHCRDHRRGRGMRAGGGLPCNVGTHLSGLRESVRSRSAASALDSELQAIPGMGAGALISERAGHVVDAAIGFKTW